MYHTTAYFGFHLIYIQKYLIMGGYLSILEPSWLSKRDDLASHYFVKCYYIINNQLRQSIRGIELKVDSEIHSVVIRAYN